MNSFGNICSQFDKRAHIFITIIERIDFDYQIGQHVKVLYVIAEPEIFFC